MAISKEKILAALAKNGIDGEEAEQIIADIENEEPKPEEGNPQVAPQGSEEENIPFSKIAPKERDDEEPKEPSAEELTPDPATVEKEPSGAPAQDAGPSDGVDVPPSEPGNEIPPVDDAPAPVPPVPEESIAPADPTPAPAPVPQPYDDTEIKNALAEKDKVIDALTKRVDSLEQALRDGGILSDEESEESEPVGIDNPKVPAGEPVDDPLSDVLAKFNHKRY